MAYVTTPPPPISTAPSVSHARRFMLNGLYACDTARRRVRRLKEIPTLRNGPDGPTEVTAVARDSSVPYDASPLQRRPRLFRHRVGW
ncbi:hypothetical protein GCM10018771_64610 [Streptomyces cellulosae]|nr:hypothetical protein GCM10018771_64610 [Streptomyces cellulosae]